MNNRDFEDYLKERLENHVEPVEPGGWERLSADLKGRRNRRIFSRVLIRTSMAAAAAIILWLLLFTPDTIPVDQPKQTPAISLLDPDPVQATDPGSQKETTAEAGKGEKPGKRAEKIRVIPPPHSETPQEGIAIHTLSPVQEEVPEEVANAQDPDSRTVRPSQQQATNKTTPPKQTAHYRYDPYETRRTHQLSPSDGWSVALASSYSNAAGEVPFTPTVERMPNNTRLYTTSNTMIAEEYTSLSFSPPVSIGLNFQKELYPWLSIGLGVNYTLLHSKFSSTNMGENYIYRQTLHYVGLPVSVLFNFVHQPKLRVYASAGGAVEKAVTAHYTSTSRTGEKSENSYVKGLQWSVTAGLGLEFSVSKIFGIYLEPGVAYFFDCNQPRSIRTTQPTQFKVELGLRARI